MNKKRRTRLSEANQYLSKAVSVVEEVCNEEQDSLDNLPENLQGGERGESMSDSIDELRSAIDSINDAISHIDRAQHP